MALLLSTSQRLVEAGLAEARRSGLNVAVVVVDAGGYLLAAARMDRAPLLSTDVALAKANAAALMRRPSSELAQRWASNPLMAITLAARTGGRFAPLQGALPVMEGDDVVGAVGVSGGSGQQDEDVARAAVDSVMGS